MGEFSSAEALLAGIRTLSSRGHRDLDAYTPYAVPGLEESLALPRSRLPRLVFPVGVAGALIAYAIMWYANAYSYPLNVGGRPANAAPAFIPIVFETSVLFSGVVAFFLVFVLCRLPHLSAPEHAVPGFERASIDRFFLLVSAANDPERARHDLAAAGALRIELVGTP
jgi:hypothetical protein